MSEDRAPIEFEIERSLEECVARLRDRPEFSNSSTTSLIDRARTALRSGLGSGTAAARAIQLELQSLIQVLESGATPAEAKTALHHNLDVEGMILETGQAIFILAIREVRELIQGRGLTPTRISPEYVIVKVRDQLIPVFSLNRILNGREGEDLSSSTIVIVDCAGRSLGLAVGQVHGQARVKLTPIEGVSRYFPGLAGAAIMETGKVALVLEVTPLLKELAIDSNQIHNISNPRNAA